MSAIERVLLVEDNDAQILFWDMFLPEFNFKLHKSRTGAEALEIIEKENIQLVIGTWDLGSMPGTVFVQKARSARKRKRMPCVIYSKRMGPDDVSIAKELGIEDILPMPLNKEGARAMLQTIVEREKSIDPLEKKLRAMEDCIANGHPSEIFKMVGQDTNKDGPHQPRFKTIMAETYMMMGQADKAEKLVAEALALDPNYLPAKYVQARCFTAQGKHDDAIAILDGISAASPKNLQSLLNLGSAYVAADQVDQAKQIVAKVKDLDPESDEVKDTEGKIALKEGNLSLAAELLSGTENGDEIARFYNSLGISYVAKGLFDKGIEIYLSAVKVLASKAKLHLLYFNLGLACRKMEKFEESLAYLCDSYISEPAFEKAYNAIARAVAELKEQNRPLPFDKITMVKDSRKKYFEDYPAAAEKVRARMEKQKMAS